MSYSEQPVFAMEHWLSYSDGWASNVGSNRGMFPVMGTIHSPNSTFDYDLMMAMNSGSEQAVNDVWGVTNFGWYGTEPMQSDYVTTIVEAETMGTFYRENGKWVHNGHTWTKYNVTYEIRNNNPGVSPNASINVYVENDFPGHSYIKIGNTVYDYGEWNGGHGSGNSNDGNGSFGPTGKGIVLKAVGADADAYIAYRMGEFLTTVYTINTLDASKIAAYYESLISNGTTIGITVPETRGGVTMGYHVDMYNALSNHCATKVLIGLAAGGDNYLKTHFKYHNTPKSLGHYLNIYY